MFCSCMQGFVLDEVWRGLGYAVKPRDVVEICIHIYVKLKSLETYMLFTRLTSMVDYFVIFLVKKRETQARHEGTFI